MNNFIGPYKLVWFWSGWLWLNKHFIRQVNSPSEFGHGICGSIKIESVSVTSKGRASVHVYNGHVNGNTESIKLVIGTAIYRRYRSITNQLSRLEKKAGPKFFRNQHKVTKTFSIPGHQEDIQTWRHSNMKIFRNEDIQAWRLSNVMTSIKEGYPSTRRSSTKKIFKLTFTPFCPSLELLSYDITYVI